MNSLSLPFPLNRLLLAEASSVSHEVPLLAFSDPQDTPDFCHTPLLDHYFSHMLPTVEVTMCHFLQLPGLFVLPARFLPWADIPLSVPRLITGNSGACVKHTLSDMYLVRQ